MSSSHKYFLLYFCFHNTFEIDVNTIYPRAAKNEIWWILDFVGTGSGSFKFCNFCANFLLPLLLLSLMFLRIFRKACLSAGKFFPSREQNYFIFHRSKTGILTIRTYSYTAELPSLSFYDCKTLDGARSENDCSPKWIVNICQNN